jgi:hypothetical protein
MAPYSAELLNYYIQQRPIPDNTVTIVAVLTFKATTNPLLAMAAMDEAIASMQQQMENDLRGQAAEQGIEVCYWQYQVEAHFA